MPARIDLDPAACARVTMSSRLRRSWSTGRARSASLPPSSTSRWVGLSASTQSSRAVPAGRGVAGDAGVEHGAVAAPALRSAASSRTGEGVRLGHAVAGRERVAEHGQPAGPRPHATEGAARSQQPGRALRRQESQVHLPGGLADRSGQPAVGDDRARRTCISPCPAPPARCAILRGVDLAVADGASVSVVGPSGSGKSSLMSIVGGIERADERPGRGRRRRSRARSTRTGWRCSAATGSASCSSPST